MVRWSPPKTTSIDALSYLCYCCSEVIGMKQLDLYPEQRNALVRKANELIQKSRFSLTTQQQKVVLFLISQIQPFDEDFKLYEFSIKEFCKIAGIDNTSGKNYSDLKQAIKDIADKSLWIVLPDGRDALIRWFQEAYIDKNSGNIQIGLNKNLKPFLLQLKQNYTQYELFWTLCFRSKYAIRLYELTKSIHYNELERYTRTFSLDDLRKLLDAEKYTLYFDMKRRVLEPAINEINSLSDKLVSIEPVKNGRAVVAIELTVSSKDTLARLELRDKLEKELGFDQISLWDELKERGLV